MNEAPYDEFIPGWDVAEMIRVFPDYIQYNTWCGPCWVDYAKYHYKIQWDQLLVKAFEYAYVEFWEKYRQTEPFYFFRDWKFDEKIAEEYKKWMLENWRRICKELNEQHKSDPHFQKDFTSEDENRYLKLAEDKIEYCKDFAEWHEFEFDGDSRYSDNAKNRIMEKIKNKDFD